MQTNSLKTLSIHEIQAGYENGTLTPEALIELIIERAEADKDFNIWISPPSWSFIRSYIDNLDLIDKEKSPLWGIPFAIKDNIDLAGVPTTAGCPDFAYTPEKSATIVQRLINAGAIPIGKTNLDQFATGLVGTRSPFGETQNALRPELISGGSSSGSAVSVARGQAAFSLGTDTAGSGRVPAALNGLIGFKPSLGAWPVKGVVPACASIDCVTVFSNNLQDTVFVDEVVRGFDKEDPWSKTVKREPSSLPKRLLIPEDLPEFYGPFAKEYEQAWQTALTKMNKLGILIEKIDVSYLLEAASVLYDGPWVAERWSDLGAFIEEHPNSSLTVTETVLRTGAKSAYTASSLFQAMHKLQASKRKAHLQLEDAVLIMPTAGGTWTRAEVRHEPIQTNSQMGLYTNHCNLLDLSAINIPSEPIEDTLPFGITLFSGANDEHLITGLAAKFLNESPVPTQTNTVTIAVCGLHMQGYPLEVQMKEHDAKFKRKTKTSANYQLIALNTAPAKPGLIREPHNGAEIDLELWEMPVEQLGAFVSLIPSPLSIGTIELKDGTFVKGFLCEQWAVDEGKDITRFGGWHQYSASKPSAHSVL
ncbi:allophanate hydrolase [Niallia taxi]|nr:allophanate hydrolase [Niallia taxi]MDE5052672.1 allophanate hydrolase [Niallia taxi]